MTFSNSDALSENRSSPTPGAFGPSSHFIAGRYAPKGSIGWHVDCSDNPMDLRPAMETILRAIDETLPFVPAGSPLVVLMGEDHSMPAQTELLPFLATRLESRGHRFSVAFECPHDMWLQTACLMDIIIPPGIGAAPGYWHDEDGIATLSGSLGLNLSVSGPLSSLDCVKTIYDLVTKSGGGIRALFNDAAKTPGGSLDLSDPLTEKMVANYARERGKDLSRVDRDLCLPDGMACRNRTMVFSAMDHVRRHGVPILVQQTGSAHLLGNADDGEKFEDSLTALFARAGAKVIPVLPTSEWDDHGLNVPPAEAREAFVRTVVIDGLAENRFARKFWEGFWDWDDKRPEAKFLAALYRASGRFDDLGDKAPSGFFARLYDAFRMTTAPEDLSGVASRKQWQQIARGHIEDILKKHAAAPHASSQETGAFSLPFA